jgi:hypothetical protein
MPTGLRTKLRGPRGSPAAASPPEADHLTQFLERRRVDLPLPDPERARGCCGLERIAIQEHVSDQLEIEPAKVFISQHVRYTYACPKGQFSLKRDKNLSQAGANLLPLSKPMRFQFFVCFLLDFC